MVASHAQNDPNNKAISGLLPFHFLYFYVFSVLYMKSILFMQSFLDVYKWKVLVGTVPTKQEVINSFEVDSLSQQSVNCSSN